METCTIKWGPPASSSHITCNMCVVNTIATTGQYKSITTTTSQIICLSQQSNQYQQPTKPFPHTSQISRTTKTHRCPVDQHNNDSTGSTICSSRTTSSRGSREEVQAYHKKEIYFSIQKPKLPRSEGRNPPVAQIDHLVSILA